MKRIFTENTKVFIFQALFGACVYAITDSVFFATVMAAMVALVFAIISISTRDTSSSFFYVHSAAIVASAIPSLFTSDHLTSTTAGLLVAILIVLFAVAYSLFAASVAKKNGAREATPVLFAAALPLGIGTAIGGGVLLCSWWLKQCGRTGHDM